PISIVRLSLFPHVAPTKIYSLSLHDALPISDLIEKLIESKSFVNFMERQSEKTPMDFNNDLSRYEGSVATACSGHVYRFASSLEDRKSTRLNSSHVSISYAVFCLKQKKKKED